MSGSDSDSASNDNAGSLPPIDTGTIGTEINPLILEVMASRAHMATIKTEVDALHKEYKQIQLEQTELLQQLKEIGEDCPKTTEILESQLESVLSCQTSLEPVIKILAQHVTQIMARVEAGEKALLEWNERKVHGIFEEEAETEEPQKGRRKSRQTDDSTGDLFPKRQSGIQFSSSSEEEDNDGKKTMTRHEDSSDEDEDSSPEVDKGESGENSSPELDKDESSDKDTSPEIKESDSGSSSSNEEAEEEHRQEDSDEENSSPGLEKGDSSDDDEDSSPELGKNGSSDEDSSPELDKSDQDSQSSSHGDEENSKNKKKKGSKNIFPKTPRRSIGAEESGGPLMQLVEDTSQPKPKKKQPSERSKFSSDESSHGNHSESDPSLQDDSSSHTNTGSDPSLKDDSSSHSNNSGSSSSSSSLGGKQSETTEQQPKGGALMSLFA